MTMKNRNVPVTPDAQSRERLRSRAALFAGFGALLILMAIICIDSLHTLGAFETQNTQIRQDFLYRERTLEQVRAAVYETSNIIRDYALIESDPRSKQELQAEFQSIRNETTAALNTCLQSLSADKREPFQHLAAQLENYWSTIGPIVVSGAKEKSEPRGPLLSREALSQHAEILAITKEVSSVNDDELREAETRITQVFAQFRRRLLMVATIALGFGLILAATTVVYAGRLEKDIEEKYDESLRAQHELKELSKRLIDAEERERRAISRELHDEVGQSLSALLLDVQNLTDASCEDGFRQGLQNIKTLAENCVNEVRNMALLLRPSMLDDLGLVPALEWQAREVSKRTGMVVDFVEENVSDELPEDHKTCVYRIVQEALNNCSKHAHAKSVRVAVRQDPTHLRVSIEDDGTGFDPRRVRGLGLVGMNERVTQLGGVLRVESDLVRGTRLQIDLPLPVEAPDLEN